MDDHRKFKLARNLCVAFVANQMGIELRTADKLVPEDPNELGEPWYHLAEYGVKLQAGYRAFDLTEMMPPVERPAAGAKTFQLDPEARQAIGNLSPELAWLHVKMLVQQAIQEHFDQSEKMRLEANYPVDLRDLAGKPGADEPGAGSESDPRLESGPQTNQTSETAVSGSAPGGAQDVDNERSLSGTETLRA
jgi:hypothetical protein